MDKNAEFCKVMGIDPNRIWHVFPYREAELHITSGIGDCPCKPTLKIQNSGRVNLIHKAFDGNNDLDISEDLLDGEPDGVS